MSVTMGVTALQGKDQIEVSLLDKVWAQAGIDLCGQGGRLGSCRCRDHPDALEPPAAAVEVRPSRERPTTPMHWVVESRA